jgi:hypothetical protein
LLRELVRQTAKKKIKKAVPDSCRCHCVVVALLSLHCCHVVVVALLLRHCCCIVVVLLLLRCCCIVVTSCHSWRVVIVLCHHHVVVVVMLCCGGGAHVAISTTVKYTL